MKIWTEHETITYLIKHKASICRYGDGEIKLCLGRSAKSQAWDLSIQARLRFILRDKTQKPVVGIPRIYDRADWPTEAKKNFWSKYSGEVYSSLYNKNIQYGSAFISRPDTNSALDSPEYFDLVKQLWAGRNVFLFQGVGVGFDKMHSFFNTAKRVTILYGPARDAYKEYYDILQLLLSQTTNDDVIVLALGPTATVLAYDLAKAGRQALDLGHLGQFYAHIHPKASGYQNG